MLQCCGSCQAKFKCQGRPLLLLQGLSSSTAYGGISQAAPSHTPTKAEITVEPGDLHLGTTTYTQTCRTRIQAGQQHSLQPAPASHQQGPSACARLAAAALTRAQTTLRAGPVMACFALLQLPAVAVSWKVGRAAALPAAPAAADGKGAAWVGFSGASGWLRPRSAAYTCCMAASPAAGAKERTRARQKGHTVAPTL